MMEQNFKEKLTRVSAFVFDMDGVLTDGSLLLMPGQEPLRTMNIKDGYALQLAVKQGYHVAIISGSTSLAARERFHYLGITEVHMSCKDKLATLNDVMKKHNIQHSNVLYMGDDIPDVEVLKVVACPTCPADAVPEVKDVALYVSAHAGGRGCARDVIRQTMMLQKKWPSNK